MFEKDEILEVEVESISNGVIAHVWNEEKKAVEGHVLTPGKSTLKVLGRDLPMLQKLEEPQKDLLDAAFRKAQFALDSAEENEKADIALKRNPMAIFFQDAIPNRSPRPLRFVKVLNSLGRVITERSKLEQEKEATREAAERQAKAMEDQAKAAMAQAQAMQEMVKALTEQNAALMAKLADESASKKK
jgi:hypothetical protein